MLCLSGNQEFAALTACGTSLHRYSVILQIQFFSVKAQVVLYRDRPTQDPFTPSRRPTCTMYYRPRDFPNVFSNWIAQTISLKNVPLRDTAMLFLLWKQTPRWEINFTVYSSEVPLLQTGSTMRFYHSPLAPRVHKNWFRVALTSSVIVNVFQEIQKYKQNDIKAVLSFSFSLSPVMAWMAPYQYILWKALWLVWCQPRPVPTHPQPTPSWTSTRTPTCL